MRLLKLGLLAYGPFTNTELDLSGPAAGGLHVIFGQNEAGKSTALRAVSGLFFGIGERTLDAHLHPARELLLSAKLEDAERCLSFMRRKRRKDSLRDLNDEALAESELSPFLHGVDKTLFHTLFGLDHERLKQGGQALLSGAGDVGESLFEAGTGGPGIHTLLSDLTQECEALFKARASKPHLNAAIFEYRQAKKQARDEVRLPEKYLEQLEQVERAKQRRQELTLRRGELRQQLERLERVLATQPIVARRQKCLTELAELGPLPELPENAAKLRSNAQQTLIECDRDIARTEREIERREQQLSELPQGHSVSQVPKHVIDELRDKVGIHRKAARDLPNVRGQIKQAEAEALRILARIGFQGDLEAAERLRLDSARIAKIRRLAREHLGLVQKRDAALDRKQQAEQELAEAHGELEAKPAFGDLTRLEAAIREVGGFFEREQRRQQLLSERVLFQERAAELSRRLFEASGGAKASELEPDGLPPEAESIERFAQRLSDSERTLASLEAERRRRQAELADAERHIDAIERQGPVPSEQQLAAARAEREQEFEALLSSERPLSRVLAQGYLECVATADELADRLRREATRVAELAQWQAAREHHQRQLERQHEHSAQETSQQAAIMREWSNAWQGVPVEPKSPREMLAWRRRYDEWRAASGEEHRLARQISELEQLGVSDKKKLEPVLAEYGLTLEHSTEETLQQCRERLAYLKQQERERQALELSCTQLANAAERETKQLEAAKPLLEKWRKDWQEAVEQLGLGQQPGTDEALAVLDDIVELTRKLDELPHNRRRVAGMERDARAFEEGLKPLLEHHAPDLIGLSVDDAAERFAKRYLDGVADVHERQRLLDEISEFEAELREHRGRRTNADQQVSALVTRVGVADASELERVEARHRLQSDLNGRLRELEDQLLAQGGGANIDALVAEASAAERAQLVVQREELRAELEETDTAWRDEEVNIDRLERGLGYYSDEAAVHAAQQLEQRAAHVRELLERYLRLRLGKTVLEREIARYRERHQGPVLSRASEFFQRLTLSRYQGLRVGIEERTLGCVRVDGDEVSVTQLSEGTQYQLYLALRLATLEHYLESSSPIPLVFDDLLIHFDDERAAAAFGVLGELAKRVQILYFTHLSRDLALAEGAVDAGVLRQHRLGVASRAGA